MKDKICAIIVTYNCGKEFLKTVESVKHQVDTVVIVDNGSNSNTISILNELNKEQNIKVIFCSENIGIAAALNKGVQYSIDNSYDWVLTMDHDSNLKQDMVEKLLNAYYGLDESEQNLVVSLLPKYVEMALDIDKQLKDNSALIKYVDEGITSGNLVKVKAFKKIGLFDEKLFIDFVDFDFCYRLREKGFKIIEVANAILFHRIGDMEEVRFFHKMVKTSNHSALRKYYITRNRMYCWDKYKNVVPEQMKKDKSYALRETVKIVLYEKNKFEKVKMICKGYVHYKKGIFGKYNN